MNGLLLENMCKRAKVLSETEKSSSKTLTQRSKKGQNTLTGIPKTGKGLHYMIRIITHERNKLLSILATHLVRPTLDKEIVICADLDKLSITGK